jgi:hypothetical protein
MQYRAVGEDGVLGAVKLVAIGRLMVGEGGPDAAETHGISVHLGAKHVLHHAAGAHEPARAHSFGAERHHVRDVFEA